jgi:hypothetical protein
VRDWLKDQETPADEYRMQCRVHAQLKRTIYRIYQSYIATGNDAKVTFWDKQLGRLQHCQEEWVGYRAACGTCELRPVAVPVGCNLRMCPFCASRRGKNAREKIKGLFPKLSHPALITLTIPNRAAIRKHSYGLFRLRVEQFRKAHPELRGGIYSLETTYNRQRNDWHVHAHILADLALPLPPKFITDAKGESKKNLIELAGKDVYKFKALKMRYEFDWLRLWSGDVLGWGKACRKNANKQQREGDNFVFDEWVKETRAHERLRWCTRRKRYVPNEKLSAAEHARRERWNSQNRRLVNIKPVDDREGAVREVLKYLTKSASFSDLAEAVEQFMDATRCARLVATFGTWYGVKIDKDQDPKKPEDWRELKCACGIKFKRIGCFRFQDLELDSLGRWLLRLPLNVNSAGTVARPTIRALEAREE